MKRLGWLLFICSFFACNSQDSVPSNVIKMKVMQRVVWDVMIADELALQRKLADSSIQLKAVTFKLYDTVFSIHGVSRDQFYRSYRYYQNNPELYRTLMNGVKNIGDSEKKSLRPPSVQ